MAIFKPNVAKPIPRNGGNVENYGFALRVRTIQSVEGGVRITGTALSDSAVSTSGQETSVFMSDKHFKWFIGHGMARSLKDGPVKAKNGKPNWFEGTEVVFGRCYKKDEQLIAQNGVVGTYCVAGDVESTREILTAVVGRPVIELIDPAEKAVLTMTAVPVETDEVDVRIVDNDKRSQDYRVPVSEFIEALREKIAQQEQNNARQLSGGGFQTSVLRITVPVYSPAESFHVSSVKDLDNMNGSVRLVAANGKEMNFSVFSTTDEAVKAKQIERVGKFIAENGAVEAVPFVRIDFNKNKVIDIANAYANYLDTRGKDMTSEERWSLYEKELAAFNGLKGNYTPSNLVLESYNDKHGNVRYSLDRIVPSVSSSLDVLVSPRVSAEVEQEQAQAMTAEAGHDEIDVSTLSVSDSDIDPALMDAIGAPAVASADKPTRPAVRRSRPAPSESGLSLG